MLRKSKEIVGLVCSLQDALCTWRRNFFFCSSILRGKIAKLKRLFLLAFYRKIRQIFNITHMIQYIRTKLLTLCEMEIIQQVFKLIYSSNCCVILAVAVVVRERMSVFL